MHHPIHMHDIHVPRGPNLWLLSMLAVFSFLFSLALFVGLPMIAGDEFKDTMGGSVGFWVLVGGLVLSAVFAVLESSKKR